MRTRKALANGAWLALPLIILAVPEVQGALSTCGSALQIVYASGPNVPNPGDTIRVQLTFGALSIQNGTTFTLNRVRFDLDCSNPPPPGSVPCTDDGLVIGYLGDGTITSTCGPNNADGTTVWSTGHAASGTPNEIVFTPDNPIHMPRNTPSFCTLEFDVTVLGPSNDGTPNLAEEVAGYNSASGDGQCDNGLASSNSQSGSIPLCPPCNDNDACTTESCDNSTGQCQTTSTVTCNDNTACTTESCNTSTGQCQTTSTVTCDNPTCTVCDSTSGSCVNREPFPPECAPSGCRITAGGIIPQDDSINLTQLADTNKDTFGGQVGAPCGCIGCFDELGHIQGNWETSRKNRRGAFLAKEFTSLVCACVDLNGNPVPDFDGITCGNRIIGPTPPAAPANVACFSGVGAYNQTNGRRTISVGFRVEVQDRGEPGTGKNADSTDDLYHLQIWIPQQAETALGLAELACCENADPVTAIGRSPDVDDGNNHIIHGNIQIHDELNHSKDLVCPVPQGTCVPLPQP